MVNMRNTLSPVFLSTLSLRRATLPFVKKTPPTQDFYPRSPCGERRRRYCTDTTSAGFLSTLSLRRATSSQPTTVICQSHFYPRSPCGERPILGIPNQVGTWISIHALLAESDPHIRSTSGGHPGISIHALLAESDRPYTLYGRVRTNFYPRSPCGERPVTARIIDPTYDFYPRSPCGERPDTQMQAAFKGPISIHALLAESDTVLLSFMP